MDGARAISTDDLIEMAEVAKALQKAQRRYNAVAARIADRYDMEPDEMIEPGTGRIVPVPETRPPR